MAAIEDILGLGRLSKYDYYSRPLSDVFADKPDLTPYQAIKPQADMKEMNPAQSKAARMSEGLDLSAADRVNDEVFNRILWYMVKGDKHVPSVVSKAPMELVIGN